MDSTVIEYVPFTTTAPGFDLQSQRRVNPKLFNIGSDCSLFKRPFLGVKRTENSHCYFRKRQAQIQMCGISSKAGYVRLHE